MNWRALVAYSGFITRSIKLSDILTKKNYCGFIDVNIAVYKDANYCQGNLFLQKKREIFLVQIKMNAKTRLSIVSMTLHLGQFSRDKNKYNS